MIDTGQGPLGLADPAAHDHDRDMAVATCTYEHVQ